MKKKIKIKYKKKSTEKIPKKPQKKSVRRFSQFTPEKRKRFLEILSETGNLSHSAECVHLSRETIYNTIERVPGFRELVEKARQKAGDMLEEVAIKRAKDGSDLLLIFLLKGNKPHKYKDRIDTKISGTLSFKDIIKAVSENKPK